MGETQNLINSVNLDQFPLDDSVMIPDESDQAVVIPAREASLADAGTSVEIATSDVISDDDVISDNDVISDDEIDTEELLERLEASDRRRQLEAINHELDNHYQDQAHMNDLLLNYPSNENA